MESDSRIDDSMALFDLGEPKISQQPIALEADDPLSIASASEESYSSEGLDDASADIHTNDSKELALALSKTISRRMTNSSKLMQDAAGAAGPLPPMGGGREYPPSLPSNIDLYMVVFDGPNDPLCPLNWKLLKKLLNCYAVLVAPLAVQIGSAIFTESLPYLSRHYRVDNTVATLATSLFIFGFAAGPVIWGPLSELYGRKPILVISSFGYICFAFGAATSKDIQTLMICRFFCGFIGGAPAVVSPSSMADIFVKSHRGKSITAFGFILFGGPMISPILGGFTVRNPELNWRWPLYFTAFCACVSFTSLLLLMSETHHPILLVKRAEELRRRTRNRAIYAAHEEVSLSISEIVRYNIIRPLKMLVTEPILFLMSLYNAFVYGIMYLLLTAMPFVFKNNYHFVQGVSELPYLSILIGVFAGCAIMILFDISYSKKLERSVVTPEDRLPPMLVGSILFPIGMFWLGWTGDFPNRIHWIVPTIGSSLIGAGLVTIFLPCLTYIIDTYLSVSASALALNAFMRSSFGGAFPLFARQMFSRLHVKWATTLLGSFSVLLIPVPFIFYKFGPSIRKKAKYSSQSTKADIEV